MSDFHQSVVSILARNAIDAKLLFQRTLTSAVTTAWGVDWNEDYIARDLMQNFFDANRSSLDKIVVRTLGNDVIVSAPAPLRLERLFYLGSEKGENDVGQYGEGFKVAATCLLRDHAVNPIAASGNEVVGLRVSAQSVTETRMHPVEYDFFENSIYIDGTLLILPNCSARLAASVTKGLTHFFHDGNPLLGQKRWNDYSKDFSLYESSDSNGHVFYSNLKRGEIEGIPIVLVIDKKYQTIERKINKDRDRNAFGDDVMRMFFNCFAKYGLKHSGDGQRFIVEAARPLWQRGHPLLNEVAESAGYRWHQKTLADVFSNKYFSRSYSHHDSARQLEIDQMERRWSEDGKLPLPAYFSRFGVLNAKDEIQRRLDAAAKESKAKNRRRPTEAENRAIELLFSILRHLAPEIVSVFERGAVTYTVARTETLLGQLVSERPYRSREVFLAERVFIADFPEALAVFLHEHAHIFGHDGSRGFTDALTELFETALRFRKDFDQFEAKWESAKKSVAKERKKARSKESDEGLVESWIASLPEEELRSVLTKVPRVVLDNLRIQSKKDEDDNSVL